MKSRRKASFPYPALRCIIYKLMFGFALIFFTPSFLAEAKESAKLIYERIPKKAKEIKKDKNKSTGQFRNDQKEAKSDTPPLFRAIYKQDISGLKELVSKGADLKSVYKNETIFQAAIHSVKVEIIEFLLQKGIKPILPQTPTMKYLRDLYIENESMYWSTIGQHIRTSDEVKKEEKWMPAEEMHKYYQDTLEDIMLISILSMKYGADLSASYSLKENGKNFISSYFFDHLLDVCFRRPDYPRKGPKFIDRAIKYTKNKIWMRNGDIKNLNFHLEKLSGGHPMIDACYRQIQNNYTKP